MGGIEVTFQTFGPYLFAESTCTDNDNSAWLSGNGKLNETFGNCLFVSIVVCASLCHTATRRSRRENIMFLNLSRSLYNTIAVL